MKWEVRILSTWIVGIANLSDKQRLRAADALGRSIAGHCELPDNRMFNGCAVPIAIGVPVGIILALSLYLVGSIKVEEIPAACLAGSIILSALTFFIYGPVYWIEQGTFKAQLNSETLVALKRLAMPEPLGYLAEVVRNKHGSIRAAAIDAMLPALPAVSTNYYPKGSAILTHALTSALERTSSSEIRIQLEEALERAGNGSAVATLVKLRKKASPEEKDAIDKALPILEDRLKRETDSVRLLRPSSAGDDTLLRPISGQPEVEDANLLRPASQPESDSVSKTANQSVVGE